MAACRMLLLRGLPYSWVRETTRGVQAVTGGAGVVAVCVQEPPGGGMRPAAVITSYVLYAYSAELQLLARQALNTFAILQVRPRLGHEAGAGG